MSNSIDKSILTKQFRIVDKTGGFLIQQLTSVFIDEDANRVEHWESLLFKANKKEAERELEKLNQSYKL